MAQGLLRHTEKLFKLPSGYYGIESIFLLLALMALARIKSIEQLRYCVPGEWGKLLGLDRIPEVKTLREKLGLLSNQDQSAQWNAQLCKDWMEEYSDLDFGFYVDGHVRVYHGSQTQLPRHFVSRQKLCLRATTDYWVNAMDGQPFFLINKAIDPGLIKTLEEDIVPRLLNDIPNQPTKEQLEADKLLHRFILIFDREGYSANFFLSMWKQRISCISYHKFPGKDWPKDEFRSQEVKLVSGEITTLKLAERGTFLGDYLWLREIRKLSDSGHQTSILTTDYKSDLKKIAASMFARWSQENFFKYMKEHYNLDRLVDYNTQFISDTTKVTNPKYRELTSKLKSITTTRNRKVANFGSLNLETHIEPDKVEEYQEKKANLQDDISYLDKEIEELKEQRSKVEQHIDFLTLPEEQKFSQLSTQTKHFVDTIKMISYRAETAMVHLIKEKMSREQDSRSLLRSLYLTAVDLIPSETRLTVKLHHQGHHCSDDLIQYLCEILNETKTIFPGTKLQLFFESVSFKKPEGQDV